MKGFGFSDIEPIWEQQKVKLIYISQVRYKKIMRSSRRCSLLLRNTAHARKSCKQLFIFRKLLTEVTVIIDM